ncbi:hypothetical protein OG21DRAFT_1405612, partial [Imleria badia]
NLTLYDWMTVFGYVDTHPDASQTDVVNFFQTRAEGVLDSEFTQATLCRRLQKRKEDEDRAKLNPTALSSKRPQIVTQPDVEAALFLWIQSMELKHEVMNSRMLCEKRERIEEKLGVPDAERLKGTGWVASFCKAYNIKEHWWHREAGSVDPEAVKQEQEQIAKILSTFPLKDRLNFDETSLFMM